MRYSIWRVSEDGSGFQLTTAGETSMKDRAMEKARVYNQRLQETEPESTDRYVVKDEKGKEIAEEAVNG